LKEIKESDGIIVTKTNIEELVTVYNHGGSQTPKNNLKSNLTTYITIGFSLGAFMRPVGSLK
jgi:hypothetical protein